MVCAEVELPEDELVPPLTSFIDETSIDRVGERVVVEEVLELPDEVCEVVSTVVEVDAVVLVS